MIVVDYRTDKESIAALCKRGMTVIKSKPVSELYEAVKGHPDMQLHTLPDGRVLCAPQVYEYYAAAGVDAVCGSVPLGGKYPSDIAYNAAAVGNYLICNAKHTAPEIIKAYEAAGREIIDVKQGYAKCSVAVISDSAIITADSGIYEAVRGKVDALKIHEGHIRLDTLPYGFIGGCTGLIDDGTLAVNGSLAAHPDGGRIADFCAAHGVEVTELNDGELQDIGTIYLI